MSILAYNERPLSNMSHFSIARHLVKRDKTKKDQRLRTGDGGGACSMNSRARSGRIPERAKARLIEMCTLKMDFVANQAVFHW